MEPATWENCRAEFTRSFVDLLVPSTDPAVWQAFWTAIRSGPFEVEVSQGWNSIPPPKSVAWIFDTQQVDGRMIIATMHSGAIDPFCCFNYEGGDSGYPRLHIDCEKMVSAETCQLRWRVARAG